VYQSIEDGIGQGKIGDYVMLIRNMRLAYDYSCADIVAVLKDFQDIM